ncbi:hypothetical protein RHSIM_Rhsim06G0064600 [Rhododendron simsii]|uniref:Uncharacterized protein n=1 Tax=Rhododendron simsii TaxID=118357 RepID=A0A834GW52_RHOSS|nr:hypothetical protein RHSIM_Rhsim06G0064600 [Rhododendron simsii]
MASGEDLDDGKDDNNGEPVLTTMKQYGTLTAPRKVVTPDMLKFMQELRKVDSQFQTGVLEVFAIGDVAAFSLKMVALMEVCEDFREGSLTSKTIQLRLSVLVFDDAGQECTYAKDIESLLGVLAVGLPRTFLKTSLKNVEAFCRATYLGLANIGSLFQYFKWQKSEARIQKIVFLYVYVDDLVQLRC